MAKSKDKKKYIRNEFVIDPEADADLVAYVRELKAVEDFSGYIRGLLRRAMDGDVAAQSDAMIISEIKALNARFDQFDERLTKLELVDKHEEEIKHLWREMGRMADRLERLRTVGAVEDDDVTTPIGEDQARQDAASAKLRGMNFRKLH